MDEITSSSSGLKSSIVDITHDLCLRIKQPIEDSFNVHKVFVAERCDYFKTFLNDPFREIEHGNIARIELNDVTSDVLKEILHYIYSDEFSSKNVIWIFCRCRVCVCVCHNYIRLCSNLPS